MADDNLAEKLEAHSLEANSTHSRFLAIRSDPFGPLPSPEQEHASSDEDGTSPHDSKYAKRTWTIILLNKDTTHALQLSAWPVRASHASPYEASTFRGADFHSTVLPNGTASTNEKFKIGSMRGPKHLDPRSRWGWIFLDLVRADKTKVHLQVFLKLGRKGVEEALIGRVDLDSNEKHPMPSGEFGKGMVDDEAKTVTFEITEEIATAENTVDDATKKASKILLGKGIHTSTYVSSDLARASLYVGQEARYHEYEKPKKLNVLPGFKSSVHEIQGVASRVISAFVDHDGVNWWKAHLKVNPVTGDAHGQGFNSTAETTAKFYNGLCLNYGFHDAGENRQDQVYGYVTPERSSWLGDLIASNPAWLDLPFGTLALPAAHDSGMFGPLDAGLATLIQEGHLGNALSSHMEEQLAAPVVHVAVSALELVKLKPARVINNIALTQKDSFDDQLRIGVRFFDFRPGYCFSDVINLKKGEIHHQHAMVPGCPYITFLTSVLNFLSAHPKEIVFVELKQDGFVVTKDKYHTPKSGGSPQIQVYSMVPTESELAACLEQARQSTDEEGRKVVVANAADLGKTIGQLLEENKRFIMVDKIHEPDAWPRDDSYDHVAYNTENPATILAALEKTYSESSHKDPETGTPPRGCIYQLQATPTATIVNDIKTSFTYSDSSSLLTYMKPKMDSACYPWIVSHEFKEPGNIVLLNDFVDGCLVEHALFVSKQRAGL